MEEALDDVVGTGEGAMARPISDLDQYVDALLALVERAGAGRWRLTELHLDDLASGPPGIVPVESREGSIAAVLQLDPAETGTEGPSPDALAVATLAGRLLATRIELGERRVHLLRRAERAERMALADALTELPNRRGWWDALRRELARSEREQRPALLAVVDLDDLKVVNDSEGHLAGDLLLVQAARALRSALRASDLVGRVGGDEFAVLAVHGSGRPLDSVVDRIRDALAAVGIRASVGWAVVAPGDDVIERYRDADRAMYAEKARRKEQ